MLLMIMSEIIRAQTEHNRLNALFHGHSLLTKTSEAFRHLVEVVLLITQGHIREDSKTHKV